MSIGGNIKRIRKEKGLTQKELADKCNLSRSYLADVERDRYNPSLDTLMVIAKNLDVKVSTLLGENEEFDCDSIRISRFARHTKERMSKVNDIFQVDYRPEKKEIRINLPEEVWNSIDTVTLTRQFQEELVVEKQKEIEVEEE